MVQKITETDICYCIIDTPSE